MEFKLLGPVKACADGQQTDLLQAGGLQPRHRLLLAILLLAEGQRVGMDQLIEQMWSGRELTSPHSSLHHCASRLRAALRAAEPAEYDPLPAQANGYRILMDPRQVDALRFRRLAGQARLQAGHDDAEAVRLWRMALAEWGSHAPKLRGPAPLAGLSGQRAESYRDTLRLEHRDVMIECLDAELRLGRHRRLVSELAALDAGDGGRDDEDLARIRMLACYRSDRPSEALETFLRITGSLSRAGLEPGWELSLLAERIRRRDPALDVAEEVTQPSAPG